jgi:hypothetical protein
MSDLTSTWIDKLKLYLGTDARFTGEIIDKIYRPI